MPISVVIADDHPLVLDGLQTLFQPPEFALVGRCSNGDEALRLVRQHRPDVLVLDLAMPGRSGIEVLRELGNAPGPTRVIILTAAINDHQVAEAVRYGAAGVVLKESAPRRLADSVRAVHRGEQAIEAETLSRALSALLRRDEENTRIGALSPREHAIIQFVVKGLRNKEIAERADITEGTVKMHLHNIYEKLGVGSRGELIAYARENGLG